jgi:agmatinase
MKGIPPAHQRFAFVGNATFLRCSTLSNQRYGVPWDAATTNRPGARFGPRAIREASSMLCDGMHPVFDEVTPGAMSMTRSLFMS